MTEKTIEELKLILSKCEEAFANVCKEETVSFEEQELVRALLFEKLTPEQIKAYYNRLRKFRNQKATLKRKDNPIITEEEHCGLCGLKATSDKLVKHIRFDPGSELNYDYYYCPSCDEEINETNNLSYKELTKQIRQILKSYSKKLSITNPDGWLKIGGSGGDYGELTDKEKDLLNSFGLNYGNGLVRTSIKGNSLAFWLIKIKRIHAKNTPKRPIAKGKISPDQNIIIQTNDEKEGLEIIFNEKPTREILIQLKSFGFRWNNREKLWYIKEEKLSIKGKNYISALV